MADRLAPFPDLRMRNHHFFPLLLLLPLGMQGCTSSSDALFEEGISLELADLRAETIGELRYAVHLSIPSGREEAILGSMTIRFHRDDSGRNPLVIDFQKPEERVLSVRANGEVANFEAVHNHIVLGDRVLRAGEENVVEIDFVAGDGPLNRNEDFLYTLFVPDRAHHAVPLFDQPNLKGRYTLSLDLPPGWKGVANALAVETLPDGRAILAGGGSLEAEAGVGDESSASTTVRFAESEPIPSYLFAFAAGDFMTATAVRAGREMTIYYRETDEEKVDRNLADIFDLHETALEWLEEYTGIPYPFQKFDFVAVPSFQYGGMEHPGSILYRESSLFLDETATQAQQLARASLIAHETAHIWFGDLVTMNWFDDVWTKEVFANFMAAKIVHPSFPDVNHELRFLLAHHPAAYGVDRTAGANAIRQPLENLKDAGSLYGAIIYQKAPIVMRQLELLVGEALFREGIEEYLRTFSYGNATWPDLIEILDRRTPEDLRGWSAVWVEEAGRPLVEAEFEASADGTIGRLTLRQGDPAHIARAGRGSAGLGEPGVGGEGRIWPQALSPVLGWADSSVTFSVALMGREVSLPAAEGLPMPAFVLPDGRGVGYGHFRLDAMSRDYLVQHLPERSDPLTRGVGYLTLHDAVLEGELEPEVFLDLLLRGAPIEADEQNLSRILGHVGSVYWSLLPEDRRLALAPRAEDVLWAGLLDAPTSTLTATWFGGWRGVVETEAALERLTAIWREEKGVEGLPLAENDYIGIALQLALAEVPGWEEILEVQAGRILNPERAARFAFLRPSVDADPAVREAFFESLKDPASRSREPWVTAGLSNLNHPRRAEHALRFIRPGLEMVEEIQRTGDIFFPLGWTSALLSGHSSAEAAELVSRFLESRPDFEPRLRGKILQAADMLDRSARVF